MKNIWFSIFFLLLGLSSFAQQDSLELRNSIELNEIEVWTKGVEVSSLGDTATVQVYLQSYLKNPRELKLNTFSSGIMGAGDRPLWYDSMQIGKVQIHFEDKQNYLHYLLNRDEAVVLTIKTIYWKKQWGEPSKLKLAFEDYQEEGKILEFVIDL